MDVGETRLITNLSPLLANKLIISHHTPSIKVFHIKAVPQLQNSPELYEDHVHTTLLAADVAMQSHFLNVRSEVKITLKAEKVAKAYLFDGTSNYRSWSEDITPDGWVKEVTSSEGSVAEFTHLVAHSNVYYIAVKNEHEALDCVVDFNITLLRTEYVLDDKVPLCEVRYFLNDTKVCITIRLVSNCLQRNTNRSA